eukprot:7671717-Pyramimonas_sp.AAC.1
MSQTKGSTPQGATYAIVPVHPGPLGGGYIGYFNDYDSALQENMGGPLCVAPLLGGHVYKPNMQIKGTCIINKGPHASTTCIKLQHMGGDRVLGIPRSDPDYYGRLLHTAEVLVEKVRAHAAVCRTKLGDRVERAVDQA